MTGPGRVAIHYRRPPDGLRIYDQRVVHRQHDVIVTLSQPMERDVRADDGAVILQEDAFAVWFTFPGAWHDIGRFHLADGSFTGLYANILTPPVIEGSVWHTTDLFLDVWQPAGQPASLLDEDEFEDARARRWIDEDTAGRARREADRVLAEAAAGTWPPPCVEQWTLERALAAAGTSTPTAEG